MPWTARSLRVERPSTRVGRPTARDASATPAQGLSYTVGKLQILRLLADVRTQEGSSFSLREFHDWLWSNGNVPFALLRYERLGDRSELDRVNELSALNVSS